MDKRVLEDLQSSAEGNVQMAKISLFMSYSGLDDPSEVPDPYFGGPTGFKNVYKLIDDACERILDRWQMMGINN